MLVILWVNIITFTCDIRTILIDIHKKNSKRNAINFEQTEIKLLKLSLRKKKETYKKNKKSGYRTSLTNFLKYEFNKIHAKHLFSFTNFNLNI